MFSSKWSGLSCPDAPDVREGKFHTTSLNRSSTRNLFRSRAYLLDKRPPTENDQSRGRVFPKLYSDDFCVKKAQQLSLLKHITRLWLTAYKWYRSSLAFIDSYTFRNYASQLLSVY